MCQVKQCNTSSELRPSGSKEHVKETKIADSVLLNKSMSNAFNDTNSYAPERKGATEIFEG